VSGLRIGTRGSDLALWQARAVATAIEAGDGPPCELTVIRTSGDRLAHAALSEIGGKRLFVKEIEEALIAREIDVAVHSAKDLPAVVPAGLAVRGYLTRADARDGLVLPTSANPRPEATAGALLKHLGPAARVGTSSVRRIAQLAILRPDATFVPIRGNLDTRLRKVDDGAYDAIVLAVAGLRRLGFTDRLSAALTIDECVPAPGQGAIAMETRTQDTVANDAVARIGDADTGAAVAAERALVEALGGGCQMPIGAFAVVAGDELRMDAVVSTLDGGRAPRFQALGDRDAPEALGQALAARLVDAGAAEILAEVSRAQAAQADRT
jgi:hydroxymethylbilane synthase